MKRWLVRSALFVPFVALCACSPAQAPANQQTSQTAVQPAAPVSYKAAPLPVDAKSQWLSVARTTANDGGIFVDPSLRSIDAATGLADVTLKVERGDMNVLDAAEGETTSTLYRIEKVTFRFDCAKQVYALVKREALNKAGKVLDTTEGDVSPAGYRPVAPGGVAAVAQTQACVRD